MRLEDAHGHWGDEADDTDGHWGDEAEDTDSHWGDEADDTDCHWSDEAEDTDGHWEKRLRTLTAAEAMRLAISINYSQMLLEIICKFI